MLKNMFSDDDNIFIRITANLEPTGSEFQRVGVATEKLLVPVFALTFETKDDENKMTEI